MNQHGDLLLLGGVCVVAAGDIGKIHYVKYLIS